MFKIMMSLFLCWAGILTAGQAGQAELLLSHTSIKVGESIQAGIRIKTKPGWHSYWINPGDSGMATSVTWNLPKGVTASVLQFPTPQIFEDYGLKTYGYLDEVILLVDLKLDESTELKQIEFSVEVDWLACKGACVAGSQKIMGSFQVGESQLSKESTTLEKIQRNLPRELMGEAKKQGDSYLIGFKSPEKLTSKLLFIPEDEALEVKEVQIKSRVEGSYSFVSPYKKAKGLLLWKLKDDKTKALNLSWAQ